MIDPATAARQLERLAGLDFFPRDAPAKKELRLAIECALTEALAAAVVSDWLAESNICPKPAEIRRMINSKQEQALEQRRNCPKCEGVGAITVWKLITYNGNSLSIRRSELLPGIHTQEQANGFIEQLQAAKTNLNQTVLSAAKMCECRKMLASAMDS